MKQPVPGRRTGIVNVGPHGAHWCQPLPFSRAGTTTDVCGYCGAALERDNDRDDWRWAGGTRRDTEQMELQLT